MCEHYRKISENEEQRTAFLSMLASDLGVQHNAILTEAKHLSELYSQVREKNEKRYLLSHTCNFLFIYILDSKEQRW